MRHEERRGRARAAESEQASDPEPEPERLHAHARPENHDPRGPQEADYNYKEQQGRSSRSKKKKSQKKVLSNLKVSLWDRGGALRGGGPRLLGRHRFYMVPYLELANKPGDAHHRTCTFLCPSSNNNRRFLPSMVLPFHLVDGPQKVSLALPRQLERPRSSTVAAGGCTDDALVCEHGGDVGFEGCLLRRR